mmetsp:Transcript_21432/g.36580  ORF Transcript_21432/g.36580 Transcript_21432/m.36580 type:complete len:197 (-) Transcript_21432:733-1323(-)|eukprot:CAMPEP_0119101552 /NCGR_PEP_ID=MMETSP1180-20130426/585_1 /TAXON_ID=3052 ORGANISM="Chlamydomonas cf sp, Strain CCMP681" /NCGR_SAMPLE_ID=MMETSP1180 /ASSEMBLY_ACC=CAM_ASM_000741 /LENGTH=196 /DNA_ID=CAMNT_0007085693 /DNA_START=161 /DNA_END=751 /DNA_ORIENTATION=-
MSLFGLTTLGPANPIKALTATNQVYSFHEINLERYSECFDKYLLGNSPTASLLEVDGANSILRASLGDMLRELLARQPKKFELDAWFTHCDFDRSAVMARGEFEKAVDGVIQFSATPLAPKAYTSFDTMRKDRLRHTRVELNGQQTCQQPMTAGHEIGWHALKPAPPMNTDHAVKFTDVTLTEGRTLASYYGHMLA